MARSSRPLTLDYSAEALADLAEIWDWNAKQRGVSHADHYLAFLRSSTLKLTKSMTPGQSVSTRSIYRYALLRRHRKGYGHLAVFTIEGDVLRIWRYFHTSQDWQTLLAGDSMS